MSAARMKHFGWGREGEGLTAEEEAFVLARAEARFGAKLTESASAPALDEIKLARAARHRARFAPLLHQRSLRPRRAHLRQVVSRSRARARRATTRTRPTWSPIRATRRRSPPCSTGPAAPTRPSRRSAADRACAAASSRCATTHKGAVTIDLREMGKVKEVDKTSRAALIEGGTYGPALEAQLKPHGLTLRHFPQSFEYSTLGGWIATRSGGHFATLYTHIDDFVESLRMVTPKGTLESRRLPGSGAGPEPRPHDDRLGRHPRRHHAGLDAAAGSADIPRRRRGALQGFLRRRARGARHLAGRALSVELPHPRSGRGLQHRRRRTARSPSWCWPSSRPITMSARG